jgi:hypothetical protein
MIVPGLIFSSWFKNNNFILKEKLLFKGIIDFFMN